ncbi:hypothetical protein WMF38_57255 [Sorangium sp. So ce118]
MDTGTDGNWPIFARDVDRETDKYRHGLVIGMLDIQDGLYGQPWTCIDWEPIELEGYRDAIDDSDDMPDPIDLEETLVP